MKCFIELQLIWLRLYCLSSSKRLLIMHQTIHTLVKSSRKNWANLFSPGLWFIHFTILLVERLSFLGYLPLQLSNFVFNLGQQNPSSLCLHSWPRMICLGLQYVASMWFHHLWTIFKDQSQPNKAMPLHKHWKISYHWYQGIQLVFLYASQFYAVPYLRSCMERNLVLLQLVIRNHWISWEIWQCFFSAVSLI